MTEDLRATLQAAFGTTYQLERELGGGGMSRVFQATETALGRTVVIKLLSADLAASVSAERFGREVRLAAALQHPNIVPLLNAGEIDGQPYYTMPLVRGDTLRARMSRGAVPLTEAIGILRDTARALAYAHGERVVHRDIKPENVLLSGGAAMVADFGIAKAVSAAQTQQSVGTGTLTQVGSALGTPAYIAPEQAAGDPNTDGRADIYSWGVLAWELLAGAHPFAARRSAHALITAHMAETPPSLAERRPDLPPHLADLVMQCLAKDPRARPQTANALLRALDELGTTGPITATGPRRVARGLVVAAAAVLLAAGGYAVWRSASAPPRVIRLAVLPFDNLGDSADAYFADGLTDAVRGKLTDISGMEIVGSASSGQYRRGTKTPQEIGKDLGVQYLLVGKVRWAKSPDGTSRVQVSPELVQASTAADKWAQPFNAPLTDVFEVQSDIASKVASALQVALTPAEQQQLGARPTKDLEAYDAYLRGEAVSKQGNSPQVLQREIAAFREAVTRDPSFAVAWARLSSAYGLLLFNGNVGREIADSADSASTRALALMPGLPEAHAARAAYYLNVQADPPKAVREARAGLVQGRNPLLLSRLAQAEMGLGQWDSAAAHAAEAARLDPRNTNALARLLTLGLWLRRPADARAAAERGLALEPGNLAVIADLAMASLQEGDLAGARAAIRRTPRSVGPDAVAAYFGQYWDLGWALDSTLDARLLTLRPEAFASDTAAWSIVLAQQYALHGDRKHTLVYADSAERAMTADMALHEHNAQRRIFRALARAYLGRGAQAVADADTAVGERFSRPDKEYEPYFLHLQARVRLAAGQPEKALDTLEQLLRVPYFVTREWLRIDPSFAALRGNPRFEKMLGPPQGSARPQ